MFPAAIRVLETVKQLIRYYPIVIPTLAVFYLESQNISKFWSMSEYPRRYTASCDGGLNESELGIVSRQRKAVKQPALIILPAVITLILSIYADMNLEPFQRRIFHACVLSAPFVMAATLDSQTQNTTSPEAHSAFRDNIFGSRLSVLGVIPDNGPLRVLAMSIPVVAGALFLDGPVAVLFVYMYVLQRLTAICQTNMYAVKFKVYFCLAVVMVGLLALIFANRVTLQDRIYSDSDPIKWGSLLSSALILLLPFNILCMLLHFECYIASPPVFFHLHINDSTFAFTHYEPENVPPPYWATAFCALGASFIVSAATSVSGVMTLRMGEVGFFTALIAAPSMIGTSVLLAARTGQLKYLWEYKEYRGIEKERAGAIFYTVPPIDDDATYPYTVRQPRASLEHSDAA